MSPSARNEVKTLIALFKRCGGIGTSRPTGVTVDSLARMPAALQGGGETASALQQAGAGAGRVAVGLTRGAKFDNLFRYEWGTVKSSQEATGFSGALGRFDVDGRTTGG